MAKSKEYELAIKIAGEIEKSFMNSTKLTKKELREIAKTAASTSDHVNYSFGSGVEVLDKSINAMSSGAVRVMKTTAKVAAATVAAITGIGIASTAVGSEFESAFAGVKKTVEATNAEFDKLENGIRNMALYMPTDANELSVIAEAAGQLGIETENIVEFTKTMADLNEATNLTSEEGAAQFAQFANITGMAQDKFDELGSTVVALGNNLATTESDIVSMAMRLAGAGSQVKLTEAEIFGFAAALSSVGIEAEAGGSAFSKVMVNMQLAAETGKNGLEEYAKVAGMTSKEFQNAFKEDASRAMTEFIKGLGNVERNGKSAIAVLDDMDIKEVRLRDTLLRASGAGDLFSNSLDIANKAWDENVALTNEANQRYATFESKLAMLKNSVKDMGISIYQDMRDPLMDGVDAGLAFTRSLSGKMRNENIISNIIESISFKIPTAIRHINEFKEAFLEFVDPLIKIGKWLYNNPDVVSSALAGIGAAIATYKVAQGVMAVVKGFTALAGILTNPVALGILAVGAAIGGGVGLATYISKANKQMAKQNLAEHFGNISLSLKDLQEVARHIIHTNSLGKLSETIASMDELESMQKSIKNTVSALNRMNWKVGIGMELTAEEKQDYQDTVQSYIAQVQEVVSQKQYAVTLAVGTLLGDDLEGSNIVSQINQFYSGKQAELAELGTQLNEVVTNAFTDGLLDMDELKEITELQAQMAKIQSAIAGSNFDAQLNLFDLKYSGAELTSETFQNLQVEIEKAKQEAISDFDESLTLSLANVKIMYDEGAINKEEYEKQVHTLKTGYLSNVGEIELKAANFQLDTILTQYSDELKDVLPQFKVGLYSAISDIVTDVNATGHAILAWDEDNLMKSIDIEGLDKDTRNALSMLFKHAKPSLESMNTLKKRYEEYGVETTEAFSRGIVDMATLGALTKDTDSMWIAISDAAKNSRHKDTLLNYYESGTYLPDAIIDAILDKEPELDEVAKHSYEYLGNSLQLYFGGGYTVGIPMRFNPMYNTNMIGSLPGHADGGIFNQPHMAWFAEEGPEAAIPLDGSRNAINLWTLTGQLLGMLGTNDQTNTFTSLAKVDTQTQSDSDPIVINYSPVLNFNGEAPKESDISNALRKSQDEFDTMMRNWLKENGRVNFG